MSDNKELTPQQKKDKVIRLLRERLPRHRRTLQEIDERLLQYFDTMAEGASSVKGDPKDTYNYYEVLGAVKFLRLMDTYQVDIRKVRFVVRLREGEWRKVDGQRWEHVKGGIKLDGTNGMKVYRWMPFQLMILASVFGFKSWVPTGNEAGTRDLLPTEKEENGEIYDLRRLCTDFTFYASRKNDKTGLSAFMQLEFFLFEDANAQVYCLANSGDQAHQLYDRTRDMLRQLDPKGQKIRNTATVCDWLPAYKNVRNSTIKPLTAGPKSKDGLITQLACIDEYGSAAYTRGKSDMGKLVSVVESSMASRREPLSFTTTTAGRITDGPFKQKLEGLHQLLEREILYGTPDSRGQVIQPTLSGDRTLCLCLEPDQWEREEEYMLTSRTLRKKVCKTLGVIVQQSYYDDAVEDIRNGLGDLQEFITKNINVYMSETAKEWITPEMVRSLQAPMSVTDCTREEGWLNFCGLDFSLSDDLTAASYLCTRLNPVTRSMEFFADMDAWMTADAIGSSPLEPVFGKWAEQGWLHAIDGSTIAPAHVIRRIAEIGERNDWNFGMFLYDPYKAQQPINDLKEYLYSLGVDPDNAVLPCRQNYAVFNSLVMELDYLVKSDPALIRFSQNPLWPWQAGNMVLDTSNDGMQNHKPIKRPGGSNGKSGGSYHKIDNWIALHMALKGFDIVNGKEQPAG